MNRIWAQVLVIVCAWIAPLAASENITVVMCATSDIGQELARTLKANNRQLLLLGRDQDKLAALSRELGCASLAVDFACADDIQQVHNWFQKHKPVVDGVVVITPRPNFATEILPSEQAWLEMFTLSFTRPLEVLKATIPHVSNSGRIAILSGVTSVEAMPEYASYGVLRKMWLAEAKSLAWELGPRGVHVNTVSPGVVATSTHINKWQHQAQRQGVPLESLVHQQASSTPTKRHTSAQDVAGAILLLLNESANITGQNLVIDGGRSQAY